MSSVTNLHSSYIRGTEPQAIVAEVTIVVCTLTNVVQRIVTVNSPKVYLSTRTLKHLFDKKPAEEYEFVLVHGWKTIHMPDEIYHNQDSKRGDLGFVKIIKGNRYFCSLEKVVDPVTNSDALHVATMFRLRKESYLKSYTLLWSWRGDAPSS